MNGKQILTGGAIALCGALIGLSANRLLFEGKSYTLYRDSATGKELRLHVATFDAGETEDYNRENCVLAVNLFQAQPGVTVRYWCEKGYYRK
jgi:hypothetical protein